MQVKNTFLYVLVMLLFFSGIPTVLAIPGIPNVFTGNVTIDDQIAVDDTVISAQINSVEYKSDLVLDGIYSIKFPADDQDTSEKNGGTIGVDIVEFYVNGVKTAEHKFRENKDSYTILNLDATAVGSDPTPEDPPIQPSGGGGSTGSGSSGLVLTEEYKTFNDLRATRGKSFKIDGSEHTITLNKANLANKNVEITIKSDPIQLTMTEGEERTVDIDSELDYVLNIKVESITNGGADISLKQILREIKPVNTEDLPPQIGVPGETNITVAPSVSPFSAITGAFVGFSEFSIVENIPWIILVLIIVIIVALLGIKRARMSMKKILRVLIRGSNNRNKVKQKK